MVIGCHSDEIDWIVAMKWLNKTDTLVQCLVENTGELVVGCVGELHLEITIKELQSFLNGIEIVVSPPIVMYHVTITAQSKVRKLVEISLKFLRCALQSRQISLIDFMYKQNLFQKSF